ncbi:metallopeptidase [Chloropicon primus]|uniref:Metallopeptidase n=1 Tax=Chloropicon primus TaxID=1764295 RepID=A0A5B8MXH4_9CHLO|nr:metallopeptidase [Chloropicon primus]UPR04045.1 metallopeptidase [Chloropicon primus]|mmetsp:Transcript_3783/g.10879  ORF Transcript_3783/g.10879 Transcript_3783/m.10879 type:complete len:384 (+) Transcript_3783:139-1290(+)|eukprot:QDZ24836.1 metallopeptidase [Chloropicon primus]
MSDAEDYAEEEELDLSDSDVVTKYKAAAEITNKTLKYVLDSIAPGVSVVELCESADALLDTEIEKVFNKPTKEGMIEKGVAFPTCLSINNCCGHFSPMGSDNTVIKEGDLVKVDVGCHIDGWVSVAAHTVVAQEDKTKPVTGRAADVIAAARDAFQVALRTIRPGKLTTEASDKFGDVCKAYDCTMLDGVLTHVQKRFILDGNKVVLNTPTSEEGVEEDEFLVNEVYAIDILVSTGEGKPRCLDEKQTTVYKRALDREYNLKMKASRALFSEINRKFPALPFTLRAIEDQRTAKLGLVELCNHELLHEYPVLYEKPGELVAHFKSTVLLMQNGSDQLSSFPLQELDTGGKQVEDEEIKALMTQSIKKAKRKGGKKKKKKEAAA